MDSATTTVITAAASTRAAAPPVKMTPDELAGSVRASLDNLQHIIPNAPGSIGRLDLAKFEVRAELSAKRMFAFFGTGGEIGSTGNRWFIFRRTPSHP